MNGKDGDGQRNRDSPQQEAALKRRGMFLFGLLGATAASTLLVGRLRRAVDWLYTQEMSSDSLDLDEDELFQMALKEQSQRDVNYQQPSSKPSRPVSNFVQPPPQHAANQGVSTAPRNNNTRAPPMQRPQQRRGSMDDDDDSEVEMLSSSSWDEDSSKDRGSESRIGPKLGRSRLSWKGTTGGSFRSSFKEEARKRYNRRMQEEYEEEMERVERIRRVQSVFNRGQHKYKRTYESWRENGPGEYHHHHHFQREDWYWKTDASQGHRRTSFRETPQDSASYLLSHHYSVLGLDRLRKIPYTDDEIKTAFRAKAKEFHPDQNQDNKESAEAKFKEVMTSYEAIKTERKNIKQ